MYNDDVFFDMLTTLPPTVKQLRLIDQLSRHFDEDAIIPKTRDEAQEILQELFQRREEERHATG